MQGGRTSKRSAASIVASAGLILARGAAGAGFNASNNLAVYWGQNSYNQASGTLAQQRLATYCENANIDIIPLAFMVSISGLGGQPVINFANQGNDCTGFPGSSLMNCPQIANDIQECQQKHNKTILLSIGGATYTEGGFANESAAEAAADLIWQTFGPVQSASTRNTTALDLNSIVHSESGNRTLQSNRSVVVGSPTRTDDTAQLKHATHSNTTNTNSTQLGNSTLTTGHAQLSTGTAHNHTNASNLTTGIQGNRTKTAHDRKTLASVRSHHLTTIVTTIVQTRVEELGAPEALTAGSLTSHATVGANRATTSSETLESRKTIARQEPTRSVDSTVDPATVERHPSASPSDEPTTSVFAAKHQKASAVITTSPTPTVTLQAQTLSYEDTHPKLLSRDTIFRPFGNIAVDGFDLDLESTTTNFKPFALRLRSLMDADTSKQYYLTAAPQCPYPDLATDSMLNGGVPFDAVFVQFYNNYCGLHSYTSGVSVQATFNFDVWDTWAKNTSANKGVKVFLGVPAGPGAAGSGYTNLAGLKPIIKYCKGFSSFGGVMAWDASQAYSHLGFLRGIKNALRKPVAKRRSVRGKIGMDGMERDV